MSEPRMITMQEVVQESIRVADRLAEERRITIWGIPRGGVSAALAVAARDHRFIVVQHPKDAAAFIDDIWDSGATAARYAARYPMTPTYALFDKREPKWAGQWLVMPWECAEDGEDKSAEDIVTRLLQFIGEDPSREGLRETPKRVMKAWKEWASGYGQDPAAILKTFEDGAEGCNEMVIVHNIPVISKCEHHLADVHGHAHVGYIPNGKIVGLSKLARLVEVFARRLTVQERLTNQVADALDKHLQPLGVAVMIRASHACMSSRGVRIHGSATTTSAMRGALLTEPAARAEFMNLCQMAERGNS